MQHEIVAGQVDSGLLIPCQKWPFENRHQARAISLAHERDDYGEHTTLRCLPGWAKSDDQSGPNQVDKLRGALLKREGWHANRKRVQRLWRKGGLRVPQPQRKRQHLGRNKQGCQRRRTERKNHVWNYDFLMDQTEDGRRLKLLPVLDEFTREAHAILVARSIRAEDVVGLLAALFHVHGEPEYLRSDNGPEFIATVVKT